MEKIHTKFCRWVLGVKKSTNLTGLYGKLGRVPLIIKRKINILKYWVKLLNTDENATHGKIDTMLKQDTDDNNSYNGANWASNFKSILDNLGLSYMWVRQNEMNIPLDKVKQRMFDNYYQSWYAAINNSSRLMMYSIYKHDFIQEN